jgi:hypothetical protein
VIPAGGTDTIPPQDGQYRNPPIADRGIGLLGSVIARSLSFVAVA